MLEIVDKTFEPSEIIKNINTEVKSKISNKDIKSLLKWYESDLGKKITKVEEDSSTAEAYEQMIRDARVIMQDKKKVFFAKRVDKLLNVTSMVAELQKNTAIAVYSSTNRPTKSEMAIFRSQLLSQRQHIEANSHQMVILSFAYSYRDIDEKDLNKYMNFLKQSSTKKFNDAAMSGIVKSLNKSVLDMANSFANITK